jgi:multidrug resistance efflux pump
MSKTSLEKAEISSFVKKSKTISLILVASLIALLFLPWEQTTTGEGKLIAYDPSERDFSIGAPISGFIKNYHIEENMFVKKGDLLFEMQDLDAQYLPKLEDIANDIKIEHTNTNNTLVILEQQQENLNNNLLTGLDIHDRKIAQIEDSLRSLHNTQKEVQNNYTITKSNYERIKLLFDEGIESQRSYEVAHNEYVKLTALLDTTSINIQREAKALEIQKKEKERFLKTQENSIKSMQERIISSQNRLKSLDKELTNASINISRNANAQVFATKDGYPLRILINDKDRYVKVGEPLVHFAPKVTKRVLLTKIRSIDMPLIKVGLKVRIQFAGWPALQVAGWPKITFGTFRGIVDKIDSVSHEDEAFYAYIVEDPNEPWPDHDVLKVGSNASAWVRLSTVSIGYEIWRLHNAMPLKMVHPQGKE